MPVENAGADMPVSAEQSARRLGALGVYVHFPWCLQKCPYCDFLSIRAERVQIPHEAYADALLAELEARAPWVGERAVRSIFFGGGTPSLWHAEQLGRVLQALRSRLAVHPDVEITVECNPSSFDRAKAEALLERGVNRVSIGVQGLDDARLQFLGRLHDAAGGIRAVREALAAGVPRVSADLIFALHEQTVEQALNEATLLGELGITHLSAYSLTIEEGTVFGALHRKGQLPLLEEDIAARMFAALDERLEQLGFEHYEVSNYAKHGHRSLHNMGYWEGRDYLGLGCGAWGTVTLGGEALRYRNTPVVERYLSQADAWPHVDLQRAAARDAVTGPRLVEQVERLDGATRLRERIMLGLRVSDGLDLDRAADECGVVAWTAARERALERLLTRGRIARQGGRLWIPRQAWLFADATVRDLL